MSPTRKTFAFLAIGLLFVGGLSLLNIVNGIRNPMSQLPDIPDQVIIFSIDCCERDDPLYADQSKVEMMYRRYPLLGKVEVADPVQRRAVIATLKAATMVPDNIPKPACFFPRHLVRVIKEGKSVDLLICFQCIAYQAYHDGSESGYFGGGNIDNTPKTLLNKFLTDANVPLSPE